MNTFRTSFLTGAAAVLGLNGGAVSAQSTDSDLGGLQEIVVTATRQSQVLSRVPISVAAYDPEILDKQNVRAIQDIARLTPGLTFDRTARGNGNQTNISIRGIRSDTGTATTGIYIDDTAVQVRPLTRSAVNPYPRIFDLERIEVLRGPQGTLFGAGSEGGTVRFITPTPSLQNSEAYVRSEVAFTEGGDPSYEAGAAWGGPLVDDVLAVRVSAWGRYDGGYIDRIHYNSQQLAERDANSGDAAVARVAFRWQIGDNLTVSPSVYYQRTTNDDSPFYSRAYSDRDSNRLINAAFLASPGEDEFTLSALKVEYDFGNASLISNTSYFDRDAHNVFDSTTLNFFQFTRLTDPVLPESLRDAYVRSDLFDTQETVTQELRLQSNNPDAKFNWVIGAYYSKQDQYNEYRDGSEWLTTMVRANPTYVAQYGPNVTVPQAFGGIDLVNGLYSLFTYTDLEDKQIAGFANFDYKFTDRLTGTVGVRYSDVKYTALVYNSGIVQSTNGTFLHQQTQAEEWTPKFGLSFQATPDHFLYASAAKGFRPGYYTSQVAARCAADMEALGLSMSSREITPDYVWSYEVGTKSRMLDRRLMIDASVYQIDWTDIQSNIQLPVCGTQTQANLGEARSRGVELGITAQVLDSLQVVAAIGYNDSEYTETTYGAVNPSTGERGVARSKGQPLGAAPWTVALSGQYDFNIGSLPTYIRADYQYIGDDNTPLDLASPATDPTIPRTPSLTNVDLRAGAQFNNFDVSVFVANLTNELPELALYRDARFSPVYRGVTVRPRTYGITATFRY